MRTYKISMYYDDYLVNYKEIVGWDLSTKDNSVTFYTNKDTINYLNMNEINYVIESSVKQKIKNVLIYRTSIILTLILLVFCVYINTYRVRNITFNIETPINSIIEEKINISYKKVLFFDFSTADLKELSREIRSEYPCYEYISIQKNFDIIEVIIIKTGLDNEYVDDLYGNIIATKDATIESYKVYSGDVLVTRNDYVKEGDILIQGMYNEMLVSPKGIILGHTYQTNTFQIEKEIQEETLTGNKESFFRINIFNNLFDIKNNLKYNIYEEKVKEVFKIPFIFTFYKVEYYEKEDLIYTNDLESAKEYGYSLVEQNFNINKVVDEEQLENVLVLTTTEYDTYYEITYLVKKLESIGKFEEVK